MNYQYRIKHQFETVMKREKQSITDYLTGEIYTVFFRKKSRSKDTTEQLRLYYDKETAISHGTVFQYKENNYIIVNKQADESGIYYTSVAQKCTQSILSGGINIPCATDNIQITTDANETLSMIDGTVILYTGANSYYNAIAINNTFNAFGNTYKVTNKYSDNGLGYLKCEQTTSVPDTYTLTYTGLTTLSMDDYTTYQLTYKATKNGVTVENPTITYVSSDNALVTVDANGLMTLVAAGEVTITATWNGVNCVATIGINAVTPPVSTMTCDITSTRNEISVGGSYRTFKGHFYDASGTELTDVVGVWTVVGNDGFNTSHLTPSITGNKYKVMISDSYYDDIGLSFTLTFADAEGTCSKSVVVEILD